MRKYLDMKLEAGRIRHGDWASTTGDLHGGFVIMGPAGAELKIVSSGTGKDAGGWEHVSVSTNHRTPNWKEMAYIKNLFWDDEEVVMQLHPAKSEYVSHHPNTLHLWMPLDATIPTPPSIYVGPKVTGQKL